MRALYAIVILALTGCGDARLNERESETPVGELAGEGSFAVAGGSKARLYVANQARASGELPIAITDGESFLAQIDGAFSGETIYIEINGIVRNVFIEVKAGETQFIAP
ncbi:MAG: hypothetical protein LBI57_04815 [Helicobacteraceae bacterium]|jgi:hypothetical protein|nr:hypothetical protein [Helicobacteraceae bacterium]